MPPDAPRNNLPPDVVRVLSFHGPVEVIVGGDEALASGLAPVAPFEDLLHLMVRPGSPLDEALLDSVEVAVQARHKDGTYSLRLTGVANAGRPLSSHPQRGALEPWLPEGTSAGSFTVVSFAARHVEFTRAEAGDTMRYHGPTPLGKQPQRFWLTFARAGFGGIAAAGGILAMAIPFGWLVWQGVTYPWRPLAWGISVSAGLAATSGVRLLTLSLAFGRWRKGRAHEADAPVLTEALISPRQARQWGLGLLVAWATGLAALAIGWGDDLVPITAVSHGAWLWGPAVVGHLMSRQPE